VSRPHLTTLNAFIREISKLDLQFTAEERANLVERAKADIARITPILASRERELLERMRTQTDLIQ
jgi:hypothetical protein